MQICEPFTAWQSFVKRISWEGYGGYANIDSYNIRKILLSFFFPLFHVLKFFSNAVHYWWRDDHFSSLSRCREKSLQSVQLALLPTSLHHGCWLVLQFFHVHDVFPCRPRPRRQCISGASHSIMFPVRLLALLRMKLTSAIQLYRHDRAAGVRTDPTLDRFYSALIRYECRRRASRRRAFIRTGFNRL